MFYEKWKIYSTYFVRHVLLISIGLVGNIQIVKQDLALLAYLQICKFQLIYTFRTHTKRKQIYTNQKSLHICAFCLLGLYY